MFCPEGFVGLRSVYEKFSEEKLGFAKSVTESARSAYPDEKDIWDVYCRAGLADIIEMLFFWAMDDNVFMCSPTGEVLKLDTPTLWTRFDSHRITWQDLFRESEGQSDAPGTSLGFSSKFLLNDYTTEELKTGYEEFITKKGNQDVSPWVYSVEIGIEDYRHRIPHYFERQHFTIDLETFDLAESLGLIDDVGGLQGDVRLLRSFEGWAMCAPKEALESETFKKFSVAPNSASDRLTRKHGRPRKLETVIEYIRRRYPNGKGGATYKEVALALEADTGLSAGPDLLRSAFQATDSDEQPPKKHRKKRASPRKSSAEVNPVLRAFIAIRSAAILPPVASNWSASHGPYLPLCSTGRRTVRRPSRNPVAVDKV